MPEKIKPVSTGKYPMPAEPAYTPGVDPAAGPTGLVDYDHDAVQIARDTTLLGTGHASMPAVETVVMYGASGAESKETPVDKPTSKTQTKAAGGQAQAKVVAPPSTPAVRQPRRTTAAKGK